jgi:large subunit ribosomal protein L5
MSEQKQPTDYQPRLMRQFETEIRESLKAELGLSNIMQVPRLTKIVVNMGVGEGSRDEKVLQAAEVDLAAIVGQKPRRNKAKVSVANFKLRQGMPVGCSVTLRGARMYEFLERLINVAIPRIRDFRGLSPKAFDGRGNYNFGVREYTIFTEVDVKDRTAPPMGMNITMVTTAAEDDGCRALLKHFGMPMRQN